MPKYSFCNSGTIIAKPEQFMKLKLISLVFAITVISLKDGLIQLKYSLRGCGDNIVKETLF